MPTSTRWSSERRREQEKAAAALGIAEVLFADFVDGELENGRRERARVCEVIRTVRPEVVLGHDPWARYRLHPDHRAAGFLVTDGIVAARDPHFFPDQGVAPHRPDRLLLFEAEEPDHFETIDQFVDTKVEALLCHRSQWRNTMGIDADSSRRRRPARGLRRSRPQRSSRGRRARGPRLRGVVQAARGPVAPSHEVAQARSLRSEFETERSEVEIERTSEPPEPPGRVLTR